MLQLTAAGTEAVPRKTRRPRRVAWSLGRAVPIAWATLMTSAAVLFTRTKNEIRMSARMVSRQIRPSRQGEPVR